MGFHPAKFGHPRPFRSRVRTPHVTNRQTDGRTNTTAHFIRVQGPPSDSSTYLADMCQPMSTSSTRRHLRSAAHRNLEELPSRTTSFPASAPLIRNSLPTTVRDVSTSMTSFSGRLKAELFRSAYGTDLAPM